MNENIIKELKKFEYIKIIYINEKNKNFIKCFRFLPINEDEVELLLSRDTDSRFSTRETNDVIEWLNSKKTFHIMRDHPIGHNCKILAGAFATKKIKDFNFKEQIQDYKNMDLYDVDQRFLSDKVYPIIKEDSFIHDNYFKFEPHAINFPDEYIDYYFVGEYIN